MGFELGYESLDGCGVGVKSVEGCRGREFLAEAGGHAVGDAAEAFCQLGIGVWDSSSTRGTQIDDAVVGRHLGWLSTILKVDCSTQVSAVYRQSKWLSGEHCAAREAVGGLPRGA